MKKLAIFALILAVIGAVVYFKAPSAENIVKTVVHKYGSQVTGTEVNLGGFRLALTKGEVEISDLTVANPENYSQPHIMSVGRVLVKVNLKSLLDKTIIVEKVEIEKPQITYELLSLTQNNVSQLLENIKQNTASADKKAAAEEKKTDDGKSTGDPVKDGKKVIISDLSVTGGNINLAASLAGRATSASVPLPTIKMQNIGKEKGKNGAGIVDTLSAVLQKIFDTAYDTVVKSKLVDLKSAAENSLNNVVNGIKDKSGLKDWFGFGK